jgi:glycosyltransferase involved in cell wall biosynthesis
LAQTWPNKEIIVVDDGSTDQTLVLARQFESPRVKVLSHPNQGASATRNKALSLAQGDYIQWLDADDFLAPDKIATQLAAIPSAASRKTLLSSAWCRFYYRPRRAPFIPNSLWNNLTPVEWMTRKFENNAWMAIESWLISRELTQAAGLWDASLSMDDDGEYFSRIICAANQILFVPEAKSYVRQANPGSLSKSFFSPGKLESQFRSMTLQIARLRGLEDSPRVRAACLAYLQRWLIYFYPEQEIIVKETQALAAELGGELETPSLSWKYAPLQRLFGWTVAKKMSFTAPKARAWCVREWDRAMFQLERHADG